MLTQQTLTGNVASEPVQPVQMALPGVVVESGKCERRSQNKHACETLVIPALRGDEQRIQRWLVFRLRRMMYGDVLVWQEDGCTWRLERQRLYEQQVEYLLYVATGNRTLFDSDEFRLCGVLDGCKERQNDLNDTLAYWLMVHHPGAAQGQRIEDEAITAFNVKIKSVKKLFHLPPRQEAFHHDDDF